MKSLSIQHLLALYKHLKNAFFRDKQGGLNTAFAESSYLKSIDTGQHLTVKEFYKMNFHLIEIIMIKKAIFREQAKEYFKGFSLKL